MDLQKVLSFFEHHNPFVFTDDSLRSLSSGIIASTADSVNCDSAEDVGRRIMVAIDNCAYNDVVLKRAHQVKTLADVKAKVSGVNKKLPFDSMLLFSRLLAVAQCSSNIQPFFAFELTSFPAALFKDTALMRKTTKSALTKELMKSVTVNDCAVSVDYFVVDGGRLLRKVVYGKRN